MTVTAQMGYGCAGHGASKTLSPSPGSATARTCLFICTSRLEPSKKLTPRPQRYYGQQEVGLFAGGKMQGIPAGEYRGRTIVGVDVGERADAFHLVGRMG